MEIMLLLKDLLTQKELIGPLLFTFVILSIVFRDTRIVAKVLRRPLMLYILLITIESLIK